MNRKRQVAPVQRSNEAFDVGAANRYRSEKLRRDGLRRRARATGLELRHSDYGYSLISGGRKQVEGRNDLTLDEVEARLKGASRT